MEDEFVEASATNCSSIKIAAVLGILSTAYIVYFWFLRKSPPNPFTEEFVRYPEPIETDKTIRKEILKQKFMADKIPTDLDAIVIGSGIGGLSCAACMARSGKRVLVLEQHDRAGGCTHTFKKKEFEFDIGLHYIGQVYPGTLNHTMFDVLSDGQLVWETLDKEFDSVVIRQPDGKPKYYNLLSGQGDYERRLIELFPGEEKAIKEFWAKVKKCSKSFLGFLMLKTLPKWILKPFIALRLYKLWSFGYDDSIKVSLQEVLDNLTENEELKTVLSYSFGDYGTLPSKTPFFLYAMLMSHLYRGTYYPRGGASELAYNIIPGILKSGGAVLARAPVSNIIFDGDRAVGVRVMKNDEEHNIYAKSIISNAGVYNTYGRLIPREISFKLGLDSIENKVGHGYSCLQVLVGLNGTTKELRLKKKNYWVFETYKHAEAMNGFLALSRDDAANADFPLLFVSFPSTKDSTWESRHPGTSVCVIVTFANYEWFEEWKDERAKRRGIVYNDLKKTFQDRIWDQVLRLFPQLKDKVEYITTGTPITHQHYIASPKGEIYGADHSMKRFSYDVAMDMRPKTDIPGLYLTGQDVLTCGIVAAATSGVLTASQVLGRNIIKDLYDLMRKRRKLKQKPE